MDVAISGDRGTCLTQELGPGAYLFAVAHGFGQVEGEPIAPAVLGRLREDFTRRTRGDRLRRGRKRSRDVTSVLRGSFERVNDEVHARTASHEDFVTAGCSLTGVVLLDDHAYLAHVGSTAAQLSRDGHVVALTQSDAFEGERIPVLTRAVGAAPSVEVAVCSFALSEGDALVLSAAGEQVLIARYTPVELPQVQPVLEAHHFNTVVTGVLATILFYVLLCIR